MNEQTINEQAVVDVLTDDELTLIVGGSDEDIKGDITINPK